MPASSFSNNLTPRDFSVELSLGNVSFYCGTFSRKSSAAQKIVMPKAEYLEETNNPSLEGERDGIIDCLEEKSKT